ncbi:MAG: tetratricopeptide repeat protein [Deltaproteobacteria bacterium]|nr:tetratricopeptide repeat protein [Deltaproteobacteria bacterium]
MTATAEKSPRAYRNASGCYLTMLLLAVSICSFPAQATDRPQKELISQGVALHEKGDLSGAEAKFRQALAENPENVEALYELGVTLVKGERWRDCVEVGKEGQKIPSDLGPSFVALTASCLDSAGEPEKAEKMFRKGLKKYGAHGPLSFNLGVTQLRLQKLEDAKGSFEDALRFRANHPSSNFYLAIVYDNLGLRPAAILAYLRFLTVEPSSQRSHAAANAVLKLLHEGIEAESEKNINIVLPSQPSGPGKEELSTVNLTLSMLSAGRFLEKNEGKSEAALSAEILPSFISSVEEVSSQEQKSDFLWEVLLPPLSDLKARQLLEPLGYLAFSLLETPGAQEWVEANQPAVIELEQWIRTANLPE